MTPEERQAKVDFIITSYADFSAHMDRLDAGFSRPEDNLKALQRLAQQFLRIIQAERDVRRADIEAESRAREEEQKRHKERIDSIEEMTKILRQMLEERMRPPETPPDVN
jgi:hypothetical protein